MFSLYSSESSRQLENQICTKQGISPFELMTRAGKAAAEKLSELYPNAKHVGILIGPGNNGGDGFMAAKFLCATGIHVSLALLPTTADRPREAAMALAEAKKTTSTFYNELTPEFLAADVFIDALFGIGLTRALTSPAADWVSTINSSRKKILALDVPSGLDATTGMVLGPTIQATHTLCFIAYKPGLFTSDGTDHCGEIHLNILGTLSALEGDATLYTKTDFLNSLPQRKRNSHKGLFGHVAVVGGVPGFGGAAILAARAALHAGTGLASIATHPDHALTLGNIFPEIMVHGVDEKTVFETIAPAEILVLGPGLGDSTWAYDIFSMLVQDVRPKIIDADGLRLLTRHGLKRDDWILTPHPGEAAVLLDCSVNEIQNNRLAAAKEIQKRYGGVIVLKGAGTIIYAAEKIPVINGPSTPVLATAGTGDILSGIIAAFCAQGLNLFDAACAGVFAHASAAQKMAGTHDRGYPAGHLLPFITQVVNQDF